MDVCKTVILVGLPGHPCITFLRKSRLSVARLRGWMLERGITLPSGGNVAVSDIIALSAGVPADPVVFMAVDWYRRKCHAYPPE